MDLAYRKLKLREIADTLKISEGSPSNRAFIMNDL